MEDITKKAIEELQGIVLHLANLISELNDRLKKVEDGIRKQ